MFDFEIHQISGLRPSLLVNKLRLPPKTLLLLFAKIQLQPNGCWLWTAAKRKGYGAVRIRAISAQVMQAHRVCYELVHGPLGSDIDLHHKVENGCIGPSCCNPDHLLETTKAEHTRDLTPSSMTYKWAHQTECAAGHKYTAETLRVLEDGERQCRECDRIRAQEKRDRLRTRPKYAKDPAKLKKICIRGHSLEDPANIRMVNSPNGPQKRCIACEKIREGGYKFSDEVHQPTKDFCVNGHALLGDNVYIRPNGFTSCRACQNQRSKDYASRNREAVLRYKKNYRLDKHAENGTLSRAAKKAIDEIMKAGPIDDMVLVEKLIGMGVL